MPRLIRLFAIAAIAGVAAGCAAALTVGSHSDRTANFKMYRTYDWGPADALPTGDPRLDANPIFKDRLEGAIDRQLALKGFARATSGTPDLLIHYHASVSQRIDINRMDREYGYCRDEICHANVNTYEAGTVVVDMVDARTQKLVWRGWAQGALDDMLDPDSMSARINDAVARMLKLLPPVL